ncbi:MAG TPA: beta-ketoacyl-[acyl-carrier-protein] synthase family protein [Halothiobacillus sp.]|nr:beta-ketoacyl-[acyl-carrier-protein] synthase family protein [Halothiobacillus sp.]
MPKLHRVVVTGFGAITAVGTWPGTLFEQVCAGQSGIRPLAAQSPIPPISMAAVIESGIDADPKTTAHDRVTQLALTAARLALTEAGLLDDAAVRADIGVYLGTGAGPSNTLDQSYRRLYLEQRDRVAPMTLPRGIHNAPASEVAIRFGLQGANNTYSIACASSATAIGEAMRAIRHGYSRQILAGGTESLLTFGVLHAWHALRAHAAPAEPISASCRPFSADRDGLVMGEGSGFLMLESLESAQARGAPIWAELVGYGASCDATHITHPEVAGQVAAITMALAEAGLKPSDIDYVNAHGTGTPAGDAVEAASLSAVFGVHLASLPVSSTKAVHGHLMGAGGAVELILSLLALNQSVIPPTANCREPDLALGLDMVAEGARSAQLNAVMSSSFAFGGSNAVLIAQRFKVN